MLQFDLQFYEELTVAWVRTVKFIIGAFFGPTGQLVLLMSYQNNSPFPFHLKLDEALETMILSYQDNYRTVGGDGGCRVGKVRPPAFKDHLSEEATWSDSQTCIFLCNYLC